MKVRLKDIAKIQRLEMEIFEAPTSFPSGFHIPSQLRGLTI